jgi:hypothetical protein
MKIRMDLNEEDLKIVEELKILLDCKTHTGTVIKALQIAKWIVREANAHKLRDRDGNYLVVPVRKE